MTQSQHTQAVQLARILQLFITVPVLVVIVLLFRFYYAPALALPASLIDDYPMAQLAKSVDITLHAKGLPGVFMADSGGQFAFQYRPMFDLMTWAHCKLSGWQPFHGQRLVWCALTLLAVFLIPLRSVMRGSRGYYSALFGATIAVLICMAADIPGATDFQSLRACWYRLHVTDCYSALFTLSAIACLIGSWYSKRMTVSLPLLLVASVGIAAAVGVKLCFAPLVGLLFWYFLCTVCARKYVLALTSFLLLALITGAFIVYGQHANLFTAGIQGKYVSNWHIDPSMLKSRGGSYVTMVLHAMFDPLLVWLALSMLVRYNRFVHMSPCRFAAGMFTEGLLVIAAAALLVGYVAGPFVLPRYLLGTMLCLGALIGLVGARQMLSVASGLTILRLVPTLLVLLLGAACTLLIPAKWIGVVLLALIITFWRSGSRRQIQTFLLGMLFVGTFQIVWTSRFTHEAFLQNYVKTELLRSNQIAPYCHKLWDAGKTVGIGAKSEEDMRDNEILGAMAAVYQEKTGREPRRVAVTDLATTAAKCDVYLVTPFTPAELIPATTTETQILHRIAGTPADAAEDSATTRTVLHFGLGESQTTSAPTVITWRRGLDRSRILTQDAPPPKDDWFFFPTR